MKRPKRLKQGDKVGVVAPAGPVDPKLLKKGLRTLERMGFCPILAEHVFSKDRYLAGTDEQRVQDINNLFSDPEIKGIFCARGGYGSNRVLPNLDSSIILSVSLFIISIFHLGTLDKKFWNVIKYLSS